MRSIDNMRYVPGKYREEHGNDVRRRFSAQGPKESRHVDPEVTSVLLLSQLVVALQMNYFGFGASKRKAERVAHPLITSPGPFFSISWSRPASDQPQIAKAGVAVAGDDDVVVQGDPQRGGGFLDILGHRDVGL
jgi:hypothetical protein